MERKILLICVLMATCIYGQTVVIPDANFKTYLVSNTNINTNGDNEIQVSEAEAYVGAIIPMGLGISTLQGIEAFKNISSLYCNNNLLTSLDISKNTALKTLNCTDNLLTNLDVSKNTMLEFLNISSNHIEIVNIGENNVLESIYASNNKLRSIDISKNKAIKTINIAQNYLTKLDLRQNIALSEININNNLISAIDLNQNTLLKQIDCYNNRLTRIDISNNAVLQKLYCSNNLLLVLNLRNGNMSNLTSMDVSNNPDLACIEVDDVSLANDYVSQYIWHKDVTANFNLSCPSPELVDIPDFNFKIFLLDSPEININNDGEIQRWEAEAVVELIDCRNLNITNLKGIEAFINLKKLSCFGNDLTSIDLSKNTALTHLLCHNNQITNIDLSKNFLLEDLEIGNNKLSNIDLSKNTALQFIGVGFNKLTSLDINKNISLGALDCRNNQLVNLDVSLNTLLEVLVCYDNQITSLDLRKNTALIGLDCKNNQLTKLNLKNTNNDKLDGMNATNNPSLSCIQVDNVAHANSYTTSGDWVKDTFASYNEDCSAVLSANEAANVGVKIYPNPVQQTLNILSSKKISEIEIYNFEGKRVMKVNSENVNMIDVKQLPAGAYLLKVITNNKTITTKFLKK